MVAAHDENDVEEDGLLNVKPDKTREVGAARKVGEREEENQAGERDALERVDERQERMRSIAHARHCLVDEDAVCATGRDETWSRTRLAEPVWANARSTGLEEKHVAQNSWIRTRECALQKSSTGVHLKPSRKGSK